MRLIDLYLQLPWTITRTEEEYEGERYVELAVAELAGFLVTGGDDEETERDFWPALQTYLESYVIDHEIPPLPSRLRLVAVKPPEDLFDEPQSEEIDVEEIVESLPMSLHSNRVDLPEPAMA